MPKILQLHNSGYKGLNLDLPTWELPPEYLTGGQNFRLKEGIIAPLSGDKVITTPPSFTPGYIFPTTTNLGSNYLIVCGKTAVYLWNGTTWYNISSTASNNYNSLGTDDELNWSGCMLGYLPILNNPKWYPEYWPYPQSTTTKLTALPFSSTLTFQGKGIKCKIMRAHKNFLFALNLTDTSETVTRELDGFRWSHPADINSYPFTWDETDISAIAGKSNLGGQGGEIIEGLSLRDSFVIYSQYAVDVLDYTGDEYVWRRRNISTGLRIVAQSAIVEFNGVHYFISEGDIYSFDGTNLKSIAKDKVRKAMKANMNLGYYDRSYAFIDSTNNEIWFCVPEGTSTYPNVAYVYNYIDETFAKYVASTSLIHATFGNHLRGLSGSPVGKIGILQNRDLVHIDAPDGNTNTLTRVQRDCLNLGALSQVHTINRVFPKMSGYGNAMFNLGAQQNTGGSSNFNSSFQLNAQNTRSLPVRATGPLHCWKLESVAQPNWRFSGLDLEYAENGQR